MAENIWIQRASLLQEGVSAAIATLHAIEGADLFRHLPADKHAVDNHDHGCTLLAMLEDHLRRLQQQHDALDGAPAAGQEG